MRTDVVHAAKDRNARTIKTKCHPEAIDDRKGEIKMVGFQSAVTCPECRDACGLPPLTARDGNGTPLVETD